MQIITTDDNIIEIIEEGNGFRKISPIARNIDTVTKITSIKKITEKLLSVFASLDISVSIKIETKMTNKRHAKAEQERLTIFLILSEGVAIVS